MLKNEVVQTMSLNIKFSYLAENSKFSRSNSYFSILTPTFLRDGFLNSCFQNPSENSASSKGPSSRRTVGSLSKLLGRNNRGLMGPLCRKQRVQNSICKQTFPLPNSNFSSTDRKSGSSKRGQQTSTQRGSGEDRTGRSRLLFSYFPGSQEEREITTNNRSVQTGYSVVQNGDSQQGQTGDSTQRLGVLTRSDRCLSTCSYSPAVSKVSPFLSQGSGLSIQGSSIRPCDKLLCFHPFDGCHSNISTEKGNCSVSIFGRLVGQKSGSSRNSERPTVYN